MERQNFAKLRKICPSREVVGFSEFKGEDLTRVEGKNSGELRLPLELCFALGHIKCSALLHGHILCPHS